MGHPVTLEPKMSTDSITLDPRIKTHVLLPITVVMLLMHILKQVVTFLLKPKQQLQKNAKVREKQHLQRCSLVGQNGWTSLCESEWNARKSSMVEQYSKRTNLNKIMEKPITEKTDSSEQTEMANPFTQAGINETLWDGMKANLLNYLPQPILMFYMSYLFRGYIALKLPFTLTANFKSMFQSSILTPDLDVSYVTGISWYFVNLLGVESLSKITVSLFNIFDLFNQPENGVLESVSLIITTGGLPPNQTQQAMPGMFGQPKSEEVFKKQADAIRITGFRSCLSGVEERLVHKYESVSMNKA